MYILYQHVPLVKQSLMQIIFRQQPEENAVIEINNLFASKPVLKIDKSEVTTILSKYTIDVRRSFTKNIYEFYAVFLNHCLADERLDDEEQKTLFHLKELLGLHASDIDFIHAKLGGDIYRQRFEAVIKDGRLSDEDQEKLDRLQANLRLPVKTATKISEAVRGKFVRAFMDIIVAAQRMSPADDKELKAISKSLKAELQIDKGTQQVLDRYKLFWKLENETLAPVDVFINLQKSEQCYFSGIAEWHEDRSSRGEKYWKFIDRGDFFLTNKRVIFSGRVKNTAIRLDKILAFTPLEDGVQLHKDAGKSPRLVFKKDADVFLVLLPRVMKESDW